MQWWCTATGEVWTWTWRAYPGVWLFVALVAVVFRRFVAGPGSWSRAPRAERLMFVAGIVSLWLSLDWPLGPIAAGYLTSAHALQFLIVTMISAPLILLGSRTGTETRLASLAPAAEGEGSRGSAAVLLFHPIFAAILFNIVVAGTHVPGVVDDLMPTVAGAFFVDFAWLVGALVFWWPVIMPVPQYRHFGVPMKILYLLVGTLFHTVIGMVMLSASMPMYGVYELAPPVFAIHPKADQQLAGGIMELGVFLAIVIGCGVLFFRWAEADEKGR
ncbi:MAG: cytochrome c oxidase assembly protein [Gemmatimonadetes bacterium]|nr:cytochrome c oxidase assembly protein [Gemmatimonadota bacterium]